MMAFLIIPFILYCGYLFLLSINRMTGIFKRQRKFTKKLTNLTEISTSYKQPEESIPEPIPTVTNIQNNYNTTQILIIEASKN